jgi:serine/threonine-protein kinase RsbW
MRVALALNLPREEISVPLARHVMSAALITAGVDPACAHDVEVALSEACTNAVKHAVAGVTYEVMINISDEQVAIDVIDSGSSFGQRVAPTNGHDHWAENGRGIALIHALSDLAIFDSVEGEGGSAHMTMKLRWLQGAQRPATA